MEEIPVIFNPNARSLRATRLRARIEALPGCRLVITEKPGHGRDLAAAEFAAGYRTIVAAGGDGSVNDVVNGLDLSRSTLGILPVGTMNVFAHELGIPRNLEAAWQIIRNGHTRQIDLGRANQNYFVQLAGVGIDAQIVEATSPERKNRLGPLAYLLSAAQLAGRPCPLLELQTPEGTHTGSFALVGNGRCYGGPFTFFRNALLNDGKLDVLLFKSSGYWRLARYVGAALMGSHANPEDVEYFQTTSLTIRSAQTVPVEIDGELSGHVPVHFDILPRGLRVLAPPPAH